jgi:hypothetical protein
MAPPRAYSDTSTLVMTGDSRQAEATRAFGLEVIQVG